MSIGLYALVVLIWGTTWFAIALQLGDVPVIWSIVYRFALAVAVIWLWSLAGTRRKAPAWRDHPLLALQGLCLFGINFLCFYSATGYIPSGLVSVVFSTAAVWNALNGRVFLGVPIRPRVVAGGALGMLGLAGLFLPGMQLDRGLWPTLAGTSLALLGTYCFSLGNLLSTTLQTRGLSPWVTNARAMSYGVGLLIVAAVLSGAPLRIELDATYLGALVYLAIPGSVIGFTAYLTLVGRIGAQKAAYATVLFPVVALALSTWLEGYRWTPVAVVGLVLVVVGNVVAFSSGPNRPPVAVPVAAR